VSLCARATLISVVRNRWKEGEKEEEEGMDRGDGEQVGGDEGGGGGKEQTRCPLRNRRESPAFASLDRMTTDQLTMMAASCKGGVRQDRAGRGGRRGVAAGFSHAANTLVC